MDNQGDDYPGSPHRGLVRGGSGQPNMMYSPGLRAVRTHVIFATRDGLRLCGTKMSIQKSWRILVVRLLWPAVEGTKFNLFYTGPTYSSWIESDNL